MNIKRAAIIAVMLCLSAGAASAATATGRITFVSQDGHQLVLDNGDPFTLGPGVTLPSVGVGDLVRINSSAKAGQQVITSLTKAPPAVAVYH